MLAGFCLYCGRCYVAYLNVQGPPPLAKLLPVLVLHGHWLNLAAANLGWCVLDLEALFVPSAETLGVFVVWGKLGVLICSCPCKLANQGSDMCCVMFSLVLANLGLQQASYNSSQKTCSALHFGAISGISGRSPIITLITEEWAPCLSEVVWTCPQKRFHCSRCSVYVVEPPNQTLLGWAIFSVLKRLYSLQRRLKCISSTKA